MKTTKKPVAGFVNVVTGYPPANLFKRSLLTDHWHCCLPLPTSNF